MPCVSGVPGVTRKEFGDYNPAGKLPVTFYRNVSQLPDFEDYNMAGRTYRYMQDVPLFPFGYGLSYTTFGYGKTVLDKNELTAGQSLKLTVPVTNTGKRNGEEVVQVYLRKQGDAEGPIKTLRAFTLEQLEKEWKKHPVLHLDLNIGKYDTPHSLDDILNKALLEWEAIYGTGVGEVTLALRFAGVVERAYKKTGEGVVILVDEYDKPMLQAIGERKLQVEFRSTLKSFYSVLKTMDRYIRFALLTGVTKFGKVSVFSDLNNLNDISMYEPFVSICGMTEKEIHDNLEEDLYELAAMQKMTYERVCAELKDCYDGYHFVEESEGIYNPFSVLNTFYKMITVITIFQFGTNPLVSHLLHSCQFVQVFFQIIMYFFLRHSTNGDERLIHRNIIQIIQVTKNTDFTEFSYSGQ